jgi:NAD(P)-dependent dehydrogenase (short-subunit alcohol dehydrogenase family)
VDAADDALRDVAARSGGRAQSLVAIACFGGIDVWVNNAGQGITRPPSQLTGEGIDEMVRINEDRTRAGSPIRRASRRWPS